MAELKKHLLYYDEDLEQKEAKQYRFDLSDFPLKLIPYLVRDLNHKLFMAGSSVDFTPERAKFVENSGTDLETNLRKQLSLKL